MARKLRVLVVDDQSEMLEMLKLILTAAGFEVIPAMDGPSGLRCAYQHHPDAILLDVMMPGMDGFEVCRRMRDLTEVPIIFVTAKANIEDIVAGFAAGADDYLVKPFHQVELVTRLTAALRRSVERSGEKEHVIFPSPSMMLDCDRHELEIGGRKVYLTPIEFKVLRLLMQHAGRVLSADAVLSRIWGPEYIGEPDLVKQYIYRLRRKIEPDPDAPRYIHTVRGEGYYFEPGE
jgi:DNA-binding response OmpR family regulator